MSKTPHPRRGKRSLNCEWCGARGARPICVKHFVVQLCKPCGSVPPSRCVICQKGGVEAEFEHIHRTAKQEADTIARMKPESGRAPVQRLNIHALGTVDGFVLMHETACPCGQAVHVGTVRGIPCVVHGEPRCVKFEELSPMDFLHYLNLELARAEKRVSDGMTVTVAGRQVYLSCFGGEHGFCEIEVRALRRKFSQARGCECRCHGQMIAERRADA